MGCGKSCVGKSLAALLSCRFIDLDDYIEASSGMKIPEIFETAGEEGFRKKEYETLTEVISVCECSNGNLTILSLGGGSITTEKCREIIRSKTECVYLKAKAETLEHNLEKDWKSRPLIAHGCSDMDLKQRIQTLLNERSALYEECAAITIETDGKTFDEISYGIYKLITENL